MSVAPLELSWATPTHAQASSAALAEPDWLRADRLAALERMTELPAEPNQLFTPYLDLRAVRFDEVDPYEADRLVEPSVTPLERAYGRM